MDRFLLFFFCCVCSWVYGAQKTICLNMIVKNERPVIERCLASVKPWIDSWVIVDTGSTDGTQEAIRTFLKDIPGELYERPWKNFGHNRDEALQLAKGKADYILFIDADEVLIGTFDKEALSTDIYLAAVCVQKDPYVALQRAFLLKDPLDWHWKGVIHEKIECSKPEVSWQSLPQLEVSALAKDGNRSQDPKKFLKDAQVLEQALLDEPDNSDYLYYLAQSYYSGGEFEKALSIYEKRSQIEEGWDQYTFWSKYQVAFLQQLLGKNPDVFLRKYSEAYQFRPTRAEPLARMANYYFEQKNYLLGYLIAQFGSKIPCPTDFIYVEHWVYSYGMLAIMANCALEMGWITEAHQLYQQIATKEGVPLPIREQAKNSVAIVQQQLQKQRL